MLKMISIPLTQLCMKCAEPCSGHCTHANHFVISVTTPCGLLNFSGLVRTLAKILLLPHSHVGDGGLQGSPILLLCHKGSGHGGAKANQGLIEGLQRTSRFSDEAAQGETLQSIYHSWRKSGCMILLFITWRFSQGNH